MAELKPGNEVAPAAPVGLYYRPPHSLIHRLSDGEHWGSLAARYKVDARTLMQQNFKTTDPYQINWYLHHYVKCDLPTPDRYNWRFSTSSRHGGGPRAGVLYITPNWYALLGAAKLLSAKWLAATLQSALVPGATVSNSKVVWIKGSDLGWDHAFYPQFNHSLKLQGATDDLAIAWCNAVQKAVDALLAAVDGSTAIPFDTIPRGTHPFAQMHFDLPAWPLLTSAEVVHTTSFMYSILGDLNAMDNGPARAALVQFGAWWEGAANNLRIHTLATGMVGIGIFNRQQAVFAGVVRARPGFLRLP